MALLGAPQKLIVVLVLIVAVLALVIGIFVGHALTVIPLDTTTHTYNWYAFQGYGMNAGGSLLDATQYATSWNFAGGSEKIVAAGGVTRAFGALTTAFAGQYVVSTTQDGAVWNQVQGSPFPITLPNIVQAGGQPVAVTPLVYVYYGPFSGGIKVDFQLHIGDGCAGSLCAFDRGWLTEATDQAYLIPGVGTVTADPQVQVGGTAHATVVVGYLASKSGAAAWQFYGYSTAQNKVVFGPVFSNTTAWNQLQQTFTYVVQPADFSSAAGTCGNGNRIEWHLFNALFPKDEAWTTTIDVYTLSPSFKFTGWSGSPVAGGSINVTWTAGPNSVTNLPLQQIVIGYGFGSTEQHLNLSGSATSATIPLGSNGVLRINGYAVDSGCRPSPADTLKITVFAQGQQPPGSGPPNWLLFFGILIAFIAVGAVVAYYMKGPLWTRLLIVALLALVGLVVAVFVQPSVLQPSLYGAIYLKGGGPRWR